MQRYARVVNGVVLEVVDVPNGVDVQDIAHPDIVAIFVNDAP